MSVGGAGPEFVELGKNRIVAEHELTAGASPDEARRRVSAYMAGIGYRPIPAASLEFERGSRLLTPISFRPSKWWSHATITIASRGSGCSIRVRLEVSIVGQGLTEREVLFWESEMKDLERSVKGESPSGSGAVRASRVVRENLVLTLSILACTVVAMVLAFIVLVILPASFGRARPLIAFGSMIALNLWLLRVVFARLNRKLAEEENVPPPPVTPS